MCSGIMPVSTFSTGSMAMPLHAVGGTCTVVYDVAHTVVPGNADLRRLGTHVLNFVYAP